MQDLSSFHYYMNMHDLSGFHYHMNMHDYSRFLILWCILLQCHINEKDLNFYVDFYYIFCYKCIFKYVDCLFENVTCYVLFVNVNYDVLFVNVICYVLSVNMHRL
jgi:hypothetical protein